jgi:hypothetical protein
MNAREKEYSEDDFEEMLNDMFPEAEVCGYTFPAGYALKELDPTAFRCAMADQPVVYICSECEAEYDDEDEAERCCQPEEE